MSSAIIVIKKSKCTKIFNGWIYVLLCHTGIDAFDLKSATFIEPA